MRRKKILRILSLFCSTVLFFSVLTSCASDGSAVVKLDPKKPTSVTVWYYYNGAILNSFETLVKEFNETIGKEKGVIVEGHGFGSVPELEKAVLASANKEVGSLDMPNFFASYADNAYLLEKLGLLADLDTYLTDDDLAQFHESFIKEGEIGLNGELRIFPVAKSTEVFMLNETDWKPFADENGLDYADLQTVEGVTNVAGLYYEWTDAQTPNIANDGKAFFGRDVLANYILISCKELGEELFQVTNGNLTLNLKKDIIRRVWDNYYVPFIKGHFAANGKYRSDDTKVGDLICYVGSTSSASYFPNEVTIDSITHSVTPVIMNVPQFSGATPTMVQQGAGMVVTVSTPEEEFASVEFLKWFSQPENNIRFSSASSYMPVKKSALNYEAIINQLAKSEITIDPITDATLKNVMERINNFELYTNKAFEGGSVARKILESNMIDKARADKQAIDVELNSGADYDEVFAAYLDDAYFDAWYSEFEAALNAACGK